MNILVTGANGQLAQCLKVIINKNGNGKPDHFVGEPNYYIFAGRDMLDITDASAVKNFVINNHISVIVNCAAYTDVNKAQEEQASALSINGDGALNLANAAVSVGAVLIHISTDYVFSNKIENNKPLPPYNFFGKKNEELEYSPAILNENAYGYSKLLGESAIINSGCKYIILRTSWLYSCNGKNFVKTMFNKIFAGEDVKVVYDQVGSPTSANDLADFIYHIIEENNAETRYLSKTGIYNFADKGVASWYDIVKHIEARIAQKGTNSSQYIAAVRSSEFPQPVIRPSYSVLDVSETEKAFDYYIPYWIYSLNNVVDFFYRGTQNKQETK